MDCFSNNEIESTIYDNTPTPKYGLELDEEMENQEKKNSSLENSTENNTPFQKDSVLTLSNYVFAETPITSQNIESKLTEQPKIKSKNKTSNKRRKPQSESVDKIKNKIKKFYETDFMNKNNNKNHYRNLLEMISKLYKMGLINSEEKIRLKQLVIEKSKKIEYFYYNVYINSKNDKNTLVTGVKNIIN